MDISKDSEFLSPFDPLDDLWTLYEGMFEKQTISGDRPNTTNDTDIDISADMMMAEKPQMERQQLVPELKKLKKITNTSENSKKRMEVIRRNSSNIIESKGKGRMLDVDGEEGQSSLVAKKMDHNAREKIRRMKVNASFLALRALLPDSRRSKKRCSAPSIVDKVIKYIPELENEIEDLKGQVQSAAAKKNIPSLNDRNIENPSSSRYQSSTPKVSVTEVNQNEAIVQICMDGKDGPAFTDLLQRVEDEGICINSASTLYVCKNITSSHLHIQVNKVISGKEYVAELKDKFMNWMR